MRRIGLALIVGLGVLVVPQAASAAVPDGYGFARYTGGVVSQQFPAGTTVAPDPSAVPGEWVIRFPGIGGAGGVVHVTAVHDAVAAPPGRWCQARRWIQVGTDEEVRVSCFRALGMPDATTGFSVMYTRSSGAAAGGRYGYVFSDLNGNEVFQHNSAGMMNNATHVGTGAYSVSFPGLGTPGTRAGGLQVTAVNTISRRCKVADWVSSANGQSVRIYCFDRLGQWADTAFTISYHFQRSHLGTQAARFGYLWNAPPLGPAPTNFNVSGAANTLVAGPPIWTARFPNLASSLPTNVQVTAHGTSSHFCGLSTPAWFNVGADAQARINCFDNAGNAVNSGFLVSYATRA